jgi:hypothetical protein
VEHALFHCTAKPELVEWRGQFVEKVAPTEPRLRTITPTNGTLLLRALIFRRDTVPDRKVRSSKSSTCSTGPRWFGPILLIHRYRNSASQKAR